MTVSKLRKMAIAGIALMAIGFAITRLRSELLWSSVSSPSGASVATKTYGPGDTADVYTLAIEARPKLWPWSRSLLSAENPVGVVGADGATLAWTTERHMIVAWPLGAATARGPDKIGDIAVEYATYQPDLDETTPDQARHVALRGVAYDFEEIEGPEPRVRRCIVRLTGSDGTLYESVSVDVIGYGIGLPTDKYKSYGGVHVLFGLKSRERTSPAMTLTQAKLGAVFPTNERTVSPRQQDLSLYYTNYTRDEAAKIFAMLNRGNFDVKFGLEFSRFTVAYHVAERAERNIIDNVAACAAKTNIFDGPLLLNE